jgi:UDP-N-acetyl-D-mannosaminuronate dehydrogenase
MARSGFRVVGLDPNARVVERIDAGGSYILDVPVR